MVYRSEDLVKVLKKEMIPALGITEIAAIALACSKAYRAIGGNLQHIDIVYGSGGSFK